MVVLLAVVVVLLAEAALYGERIGSQLRSANGISLAGENLAREVLNLPTSQRQPIEVLNGTRPKEHRTVVQEHREEGRSPSVRSLEPPSSLTPREAAKLLHLPTKNIRTMLNRKEFARN